MSARESIIPVFVPHLGCPHNCVFCNQNRISGQLEPATPQTVTDEIENAAAFLPKGGKRQLAFYGGSFTAIPAAEQEALLGAAKTYLDRGEINAIRLSTRPDAIDETVLERLHRYGVETVELGAQSMDAQVLRRSARGHTAEDVERASKLIKASGFRLILQMMTGLPGDTAEKDIETARKIIALEPDGVRIYPTVIVRDTALYDMWRAGKYREHTVEDAVSVCAQLVPLFEAAGIPIIRLGLNPTDDLSGGDAAGGAYHPALGELVRSRIMLQKARELLDNSTVTSPITGRVQKINENDTTASDGKPAAYITIQQSGAYRVKGVLGELQRGSLKEGDRVKLVPRTEENAAWTGTVTLVDYENPTQGSDTDRYSGMSSDEMTSASRYPFYVELDSTDGLMLGQHLYIELDTGTDAPGVGISGTFLCYNEDGSAYVWAEKGGKLEKRAVTLGDYDPMTDVQKITEGLSLEDYIAYPDPELCRSGAPTTHDQPVVETEPVMEPAVEEGGGM